GPAFFLWADFGLQAAKMGFDTELWLRVLPVLLRAERIFALVFGKPRDGAIPKERLFRHYTPPEAAPLHPDAVTHLRPLQKAYLESLEEEATSCAKFAFPGEAWPAENDGDASK
ncbi:MAG: hypothetical protein AAF483_12360, partial [Planctomycetota bacterium]